MRRASRRRVSYVITHNKDDHGHLLGINSLALDTTTLNPETGKPEGILYSAGRDGVIASWDLHLPFRDKKNKNINGSIHKSIESFNEINDMGDMLKKNWEIDDVDLTSQSPPPSTFRQSFQSHTDWVNDIILCHNCESLISASSDCKLKLWHPHKSNSPYTIGCHTDYIKTLAYAPGPGWVASGGFDRKIIIWDITECRPSSFGITSINFVDYERSPIATIAESSLKLSVYALACNPIGTVIASGSPEKVVRLWDPRSTKQITSFTGHTDNIRAILVSDDGELILSGSSDTTIKLWSLKAQRCINTFTVHSDSVWSLYSDHPRLESFYAGCKDGLVTKIDYSGCAEIRDGECIAVCKEEAGVVKLIALDNKYIWTATSDSSIKRWLDVPSRRIRKVMSRTSSPSVSPTSPQLSPLPPPLTIPPSAIINLTSAGISYGMTLDPEVATLYSVTTDDQKMESFDIEDPVPVRDSPDFVIKGQHGLVKHYFLNDRRHIITLDNSGEVALWDIILCIRVKTFGKRDINEVVQEVNTIEYIPTWCEVDTRIGALTIHLDERNCFDAEAYADELDLEGVDIRDDQRINLGKWVLRYLFANFTRAAIQLNEEYQAQNLLMQQQRQPDGYRRELQDGRSLTPQPQRISFPSATIQPGQLIVNKAPTTPPTVATTLNVNSPPTTTSTLPQSPTTPLAAFTGPFTAPASTGAQQSDYFSGSHNSPTSPTGASGSLTPPGSTSTETLGGQLPASEVIKPPPPALINQTSSSSGTSSSIFSRFKPPFRSKISRTLNTEAKPESGGTNVSSEDQSDTKTDLKLTTSTQSQDEHTRKDEESKINSPTKSKVQMQHAGVSSRYHNIQHDQIHSIRNIRHLIQPPFVTLPISETPEIQIPPHTTVIISEVSPEASTFVDLYHGTVETMDKDVELIELKAPLWLMEFLLKNKVALKESVKIGFTLKPHEGSELEDLPNGNSRLTANRMLRARKILVYIVEKLELDQPEVRKDEVAVEKTLLDTVEKEEEKAKNALKPEMWLELVCLDQILPPTMTLATIKSHIWKLNGDLVMTYRLRMRSV